MFFTHPFTGKTYMYIAEFQRGRLNGSGWTTWVLFNAPKATLTGLIPRISTTRLKFDDTLQDSIAHNDGSSLVAAQVMFMARRAKH